MAHDAASSPPNQALLDRVEAEGAWFTAQKTQPVWAMRLEQSDTIATPEGDVSARAGDYLCRGGDGSRWPQAPRDFERKYEPTGRRDADGWAEYRPHPRNSRVRAAAIPVAFEVAAPGGTLRGQPHDYLVKRYDDREVRYPDDVWVVGRATFEATYARVEDESGREAARG